MVEHRQLDYMQLGSRAAKTAFAMKFVRELRKKGIRFLKRDPKAGDKKIWRDVGDTKMREKVSQNLREHQPELKKQLAEDLKQQRVLGQDLFQHQTNIGKSYGMDDDTVEGKPGWDVGHQHHEHQPYARLPPQPVKAAEQYPDDQHEDPRPDHQDHNQQRQLPLLGHAQPYPNHPIGDDMPSTIGQLPFPEPPFSDLDLDMDFDPIPFDGAVGAATAEDLWSPGAVEALRTRDFADNMEVADREEDQEVLEAESIFRHERRSKKRSHSEPALAFRSLYGVEHGSNKRRSISEPDEQSQALTDEDVLHLSPPRSSSYYPSFQPPPVNESSHEDLFRGLGPIESGHDPMDPFAVPEHFHGERLPSRDDEMLNPDDEIGERAPV